jgi:methionine-gamma-lyase
MSKKFDYTGTHTACIHAGGEVDPMTGAVSTPIYQSSTFAFQDTQDGADKFSGNKKGYIYTRLGNPTVMALENAVTELEGGHAAIATSSGMAAVSSVFFALLASGDHIIGTDAVYGPTQIILGRDFAKFGVQSSFVDTSDVSAVKKAIKPNTKVIFIETPANPTIKCTDIQAVAELAKAHNAVLVVDNTFASPILQNPFKFGANVIVHSMTKFLNGHSDVVAGMIIVENEKLYKQIKPVFNNLGGCIDPHQAWLVHRGLKTLAMRVERGQETAMKLATFLENHSKVEWVCYPGLDSYPQKELINRQMNGPGSLMSFEVKGGIQAGKKLLDHIKLSVLAVSLGGLESLIQHPASMTHAGMSKEARIKAGISDGLIRFSVGCESYDDLKKDLDQALEYC